MAEVREAKSSEPKAPRGPISMKNVRHIEIHPQMGGGYRIEHHMNNMGSGAYQPPRMKMVGADSEEAGHIAALLGHAKEEPGGKPDEEGEHEKTSKPGRAEADEEGEQ